MRACSLIQDSSRSACCSQENRRLPLEPIKGDCCSYSVRPGAWPMIRSDASRVPLKTGGGRTASKPAPTHRLHFLVFCSMSAIVCISQTCRPKYSATFNRSPFSGFPECLVVRFPGFRQYRWSFLCEKASKNTISDCTLQRIRTARNR